MSFRLLYRFWFPTGRKRGTRTERFPRSYDQDHREIPVFKGSRRAWLRLKDLFNPQAGPGAGLLVVAVEVEVVFHMKGNPIFGGKAALPAS